MTLPRRNALWIASALALWMGSCGDDSSTSPSEVTTATTDAEGAATVTITITPSPVSASASPDGKYSWSGAFVATVLNTNTVPITIQTMAADLQQASGGIVVTPIPDTDESFRFDVRAPFNRVDTNATMDIPFIFYYTLPNLGREALVDIELSVVTDDDIPGSVSATVSIQ